LKLPFGRMAASVEDCLTAARPRNPMFAATEKGKKSVIN
jgi:hypothetical protein